MQSSLFFLYLHKTLFCLVMDLLCPLKSFNIKQIISFIFMTLQKLLISYFLMLVFRSATDKDSFCILFLGSTPT